MLVCGSSQIKAEGVLSSQLDVAPFFKLWPSHLWWKQQPTVVLQSCLVLSCSFPPALWIRLLWFEETTSGFTHWIHSTGLSYCAPVSAFLFMINLLWQMTHCPRVSASAPACTPHGNQRAWHFFGDGLGNGVVLVFQLFSSPTTKLEFLLWMFYLWLFFDLKGSLKSVTGDFQDSPLLKRTLCFSVI